MKKIKVCMVLPEYIPEYEGISLAVQRIARNLPKHNIEPHIVAFSKSNKVLSSKTFIQSKKEGGLDVHITGPYFKDQTDAKYSYGLDNVIFALEKLDQEHSFDLFHGFYAVPSGFVATVAAKKRKKPALVSIRGNDIARDILNPLKFPFIEWTIQNANRLTFVSSDLLELADIFFHCRRKSKVIFNSVEPPQKIKRVRKPKRLRGFVVGCMGELKRKKGFVYLLHAFKEFLKNRNSTLLLVGDIKKTEKKEYLQLINRLKIGKHIIVTGFIPQEEARAYFDFMDVFAVPSFSEGCPNSLLEAMFAEKAIIGGKAGAIPEIITHNYNGLLVEPRSEKEILNALLVLANNKNKRDMLARAARKTAIEKFNTATEGRKWAGLYRKLI